MTNSDEAAGRSAVTASRSPVQLPHLPAFTSLEGIARLVFGGEISERALQEIKRSASWAPRSVVLGERKKLESTSEWIAAATNMAPREQTRCEPAQLARARALRSASVVS